MRLIIVSAIIATTACTPVIPNSTPKTAGTSKYPTQVVVVLTEEKIKQVNIGDENLIGLADIVPINDDRVGPDGDGTNIANIGFDPNCIPYCME
tara:strand:- start:153 stop:434 length:282 start_codon:yes stop_codon:yes gene_type:complete